MDFLNWFYHVLGLRKYPTPQNCFTTNALQEPRTPASIFMHREDSGEIRKNQKVQSTIDVMMICSWRGSIKDAWALNLTSKWTFSVSSDHFPGSILYA